MIYLYKAIKCTIFVFIECCIIIKVFFASCQSIIIMCGQILITRELGPYNFFLYGQILVTRELGPYNFFYMVKLSSHEN